ncbi:phage tail sheath family protein [Terribacillus sp. 7520-G]|uniref:phage tail sheath family protein n=1 Tax=Terribacillus TaxID=459532 RepID=UPI000BA6194A|nr:phage tail sheath family protein [Terribacillus sp. 7520-G]PAD38609.1 phage tail sheath protein [Terribacillus sp. 7520-G]
MNGGTFTSVESKQRAGIYFNFKTLAQDRLASGVTGTVALPVVLSWGPAKQFLAISTVEDLNKKIGLNIDDPTLLLYREAKKKAQTVLLYRLNQGEQARAQLSETLAVTAKYGGEKGNDISIRISENVLDTSRRDVLTFVGTDEVDRQTVAAAEELKANNYVSFEGTGELTPTAGTSLLGGNNGQANVQDYTDFLAAAETEYFNSIALPVEGDEQLKATFTAFIKRIRDNQGIKVTGVLAGYRADHEGVINVTEGVLLEDGTRIEPHLATAWVAGASAAAGFNQSLTFVEYAGAVDVLNRLDEDQIIEKLNKGEFIFSFDPRDKTVSVEKDISSLTSFTTEKNKMFSKNKIVRVLDSINNDLTAQLKDLIKARKEAGSDIPASQDGLQFVRSLYVEYMTELQAGGGIENFDSETDIQIQLTEDRDGFITNMAAQPVDAAEKFFFNVEVR